MPSALILAAAPDRMVIYDKRALKALGILGIALDTSDGWYRGYMQTVEKVRAEVRGRGKDWSARDVDKALFQLGK